MQRFNPLRSATLMIALMGLDAETGVFMLLFLDLSYDEAKAKGIAVTKGLFPWTASGRAIAISARARRRAAASHCGGGASPHVPRER